jgi:WD40 repeat protein/adenylylsulfate kinase-like enzyme
MSNNAPVKTILILAANPKNTAPLRLDQEIREIDEGLRRANKREQYKLEQKWAVRSRDFYRGILDYQPQIVHFCGHGAGEEGIVLEDDTGKMELVQTKALASMFELFAKKGVECVILNACYSEGQAEAISQYVNYVVGMNRAVGDKAAVAFAVAFYDGIAAGYEVEEAYELGCSQMMSFREQETPVFKKKKFIHAPINDSVVAFEDVIPPNPYQGLSAFGEEDADFFFGQEKFVNNLWEVTHKQSLVAVVGPSGSGKSSVVYAGLIPKLRKEGNWLIASFRPGKEPFLPLASALVRQLEPEAGETKQLREAVGLASNLQNGIITLQQVVSRILDRNSGKRFLLVADQFEELYTLCQVKEEQERFVNELLTAIAQENITLVLTLRADFYGYVLSYRPLRDALEEYTPQLLSSMKREELQAAIELPAQKLEVQLEAQLTQHILDDVGEEPGNLPLLEFALTRLWEKQINRELTHQAYEEIGGVKKAIANHAEQVYQQLSETEKNQAQRIFVQLVRPGEGTEDTRRMATRAEVGEDNWNLVSYLAGYPARLVVTGRQEPEDTVEVVHEALIREWGTLREWINANRQFRTWQERLKVALGEWKNSNHDSGALLRGVPLTVAEDWLRKRADEMTQEERDFIQVSVQERHRERQKKQRRRQLTIMGLSGFSVIALGLAGIAGYGWWSAAINQIHSLTRRSDELLDSKDSSKGVKASLRAYLEMRRIRWVDANTRTQVQLALLNTVSNVATLNNQTGHTGKVNSISFSPNRKVLATASDDNTVKLWDTRTYKEIKTLIGHIDRVHSVSFSPNGKVLATGSADQTVKLWDTRTYKEIKTLTKGKQEVRGISFSPNGKILAVATYSNTVQLWDTSTYQVIKTLDGHKAWVQGVSFSPDGKMLASVSGDKQVKLWNTSTYQVIKTLTGYPLGTNGVSFSPDSKKLAYVSDGKVKLWDTSTHKEIKTLTGDKAWVHVSFSPNGKMLTSVSSDNTVKLWDTSTNKEIKTLTKDRYKVWAVSFSPDSKMLAFGDEGNEVKLWNTSTNKEIKTLSGHMRDVYDISFSPDGKMLASASRDNTVKLWNTSTNKEIKTLIGHKNSVRDICFSPNGKMLASASDDKTVKLWNTSTYKIIETLTGSTSGTNGLSFSPDSKKLAYVSDGNKVKVWDTTTHKVTKTLTRHRDQVKSVSFSPDAKMLATASADKTVKLWDTSTYQEIKTSMRHENWVYSVSFSPDGKMLASASADKTMKLWNTSSYQQIKTLIGHKREVLAVSFSHDSKLLASISLDPQVKLWDTTTGKEIKTLTGHTQRVNSVSFSPDGKLLATASNDNTVKLWRRDVNYLVKEGCNFIDNYLKLNSNDEEASEIDRKLCNKF